jgi:Tol biopolymer transport system component
VAALVAAAAAAGYLIRPRNATAPAADWSDLSLSLLTTDPGYEGEPTFSPDGRTIAYVADRDGNFEIYLQQIDGGPAINLTKNSAADVQPAFSPDGREIAFVSNRAGTSDIFHAAPGLPLVGGDIWIMPALGGPARKIVENGNFPSWTPDGSAILYVHGSFRSTRIARVPATGGESRDIPIEDVFVARYFYPRMSGEGRWLLYQNGNQIEVAPAAGGKAKALALGMAPTWGPRSESILYTDDTPGRRGSLRSAPFSASRGELSGPSRPLTFGSANDLGAVASPDGTAIAFSAVDDTLNLEELPFDAEAGRVLGPPRELTAGNNRVGFFDASPDGKAVIFAAQRGATSHLWRIDPPEPPVELTHDPDISEDNPEWSPDGRLLAFARRGTALREGAYTLWVMKPDGTTPRRVADFSGEAGWLPDGKVVVQQGDRLLRLDLASGAAEPIPRVRLQRTGGTLLKVDGTGKWIAYQTTGGGPVKVEAVPISGGEVRPISTGPYDAYHPFFSPSDRWLYFQPGHKNLYRVPGPAQDWKTAPPEKVTDFSGLDLYIENPRISRDGSKLFYTRGRRTGDIFVLRLGASGPKKTAK